MKKTKTRNASRKSSKGKTNSRSSSRTPLRTTKKLSGVVTKVGLKGTVAKGKPHVGQVRLVPWSSVPVESLNPLLGLHFVVGENVMLARVLLKKGAVVPEHSHPNEQITFVLEGALKFWIDGRELVVNSGEVLTIPPNIPHKAEALADTVDFDVFNPPRADWMNKTNAYLR